jgi:hypothetical protein
MDPRLNDDVGKKKSWFAIALSAFVAFLLTGCLYTTHHFNSGRILEPGKTAVTFGLGREKIFAEGCPEEYYRTRDTLGTLRCSSRTRFDEFDTATIPTRIGSQTIPKFSVSYRLGVRGPWGPFTGVEMGWQIEAPTNPGTVEFDLKFGLPISKRLKARHSLSAGWGVGMWADNSYFAEYAASRDFGSHALYGSYRFSYLATQPADLDSSFNNWKFTSHRRYIHQAALGFYLKLPDWIILPDYVTPQVNITFPVVSPFVAIASERLDPYLVNFNLGFGWNF